MRSFSRFLDDILRAKGFERKGRSNWYLFRGGAVIVVNLQKSAFGAGVYLNYGLSFASSKRRRYPKHYDCVMFGRNPVLSQRAFRTFQNHLNNVGGVRAPSTSRWLMSAILMQIDLLMEVSSVGALLKKVEHGKLSEMIVDRPALGLPP